MKCPRCGKENNNTKFCTECGTNLIVNQPTQMGKSGGVGNYVMNMQSKQPSPPKNTINNMYSQPNNQFSTSQTSYNSNANYTPSSTSFATPQNSHSGYKGSKSQKSPVLKIILIILLCCAVTFGFVVAISSFGTKKLMDRANVAASNVEAGEMTNAIERFCAEYDLYVNGLSKGLLDFNSLYSAEERV